MYDNYFQKMKTIKNAAVKVRILNPLPGEAHFTSLDRAWQHVRKGIAQFVEGGIKYTHSLRNFRRESKTQRDYWASQRKCINWSASGDSDQRLYSPGEVRS